MFEAPVQYSPLPGSLPAPSPNSNSHLSFLLQVLSHYASTCLFGLQFILLGTAVLFPMYVAAYKGPTGLHAL